MVAVDEAHDLAGPLLRHITVQSQRLFLRRRTKDQASSSSRTSLALAADRVFPTAGRLRCFFSHRVIVLREMPKVRLSPRSEERFWQTSTSTLRSPLWCCGVTLLAPHSRRRYCWLPQRLCPFLTRCALPPLAAVMNLAGLDHRCPPLQG